MNNFFGYIFGWGFSRYSFITELFIAELLINIGMKKRNHFIIRFIGMTLLYWVTALGLPETIFGVHIGSYVTIVIFAISIFLPSIAWKMSPLRQIFNCMAAYGIQAFTVDIEVICRNLFDVTLFWEKAMVAAAICFLVYVAAYMIFVKSSWEFNDKDIANPLVIFLSFGTFILSDIMAKIGTMVGFGSHPIFRVMLAISIFLGLCFQFMYIRSLKLNNERARMEGLLKAEQRQYTISKKTIESVNIKCHDLKHQIQAIRDSLGTGTENEAIDEMEEAVNFYDNVAKTGNAALDSILTEKGLMCKTKNIEFRYMVSSKNISSIHGHDLYPLMGNAIDNAIEAVDKIEEEPKRSIFLNIFENSGFISIHIENYCLEKPNFIDGIPTTTKKDITRHGFGTKSMSLITDKYKGQCIFSYDEGIFNTDILIPVL